MYFLARLRDFDETTWLGPIVENMSGFDRYVTSLYWSIVTFATVGYGDFSPSNADEKLLGSIFMLLNIGKFFAGQYDLSWTNGAFFTHT